MNTRKQYATQQPGWFLAVILLVCVIAVGLVAWLFYQYQEKNLLRTARESLTTIADLKVNQIGHWYNERRGDVAVIFHNPMVLTQARQFLADPAKAGVREDLVRWMQAVQREYDYSRVALYDAQGIDRLSVPSNQVSGNLHFVENIQGALRANKPIATDLHRGYSNQPVHMSFWIPIGTEAVPAQMAEGAFLLEIDPQRFLYPLVRTWPTPSPSAETLLVRREGDDVVYLNELRHRTNTALALRFPLSQLELPAARAVRGESGIVEGRDYRGIPVLSAIEAVKGTPWFMVAKIDRDEFLASLRRRAWITGGMALLLALAGGLAVVIFWTQRNLQLLHLQLAERQQHEKEIHRHNRLFATLSHVNQAVVRASSRDELLPKICQITIEHGGFKMAWIGWLDPQTKTVRPVASVGDAGGHLSRLEINPEDRSEDSALTGVALRAGTYCVSNDYLQDSRLKLPAASAGLGAGAGRWHDLAVAKGLQSAAAFPFRFQGELRGVLMLYVEERDFFQTEEIKLLEEVCLDISFALDQLRKEEQRIHAEEALSASEVRYRRLFESAKDGILILEAETGLVVDVNPFLIGTLGFSHESFRGKKIWELGFLKDIVANQDHFAELRRKEYIRYEDMPLETADGRRIDVEFVSNVYRVNHHQVIQCNIRDITERKRALEVLRLQTLELRARNEELTRFNRVAVGRELRMIELKREVNELCHRLGEPPRHRISLPPGEEGGQ